MKYRLNCILDISCPNPNIDVEVSIETGSRSIAPFKRNVNIQQILANSCNTPDLGRLLWGTGQVLQPFVILHEQLGCPKVQSVLKETPWIFLRKGKSSLKKLTDISAYLPNVSFPKYAKGKIIQAELYICDLVNWTRSFDIRFRYEHCDKLFPTVFTEVPYQSDNGLWMSRDIESETTWLNLLEGGKLDIDGSTICFDDMDSLNATLKNGWTLFVMRNGKRSQMHSVHSKNGIDWFSSDISTEIEEDVLTAYLQGRNYLEVKGSFNLINKEILKDRKFSGIAAMALPEFDWNSFFSESKPLSDDEKRRIGHILETKVNAILKPYQVEGVFWLSMMRNRNSGCLLADDMGLGKTIQILAFFTTLPHSSNFLIVCPASVTGNWMKEIKKFTPALAQQITVASYEMVRLHQERFTIDAYDTLVVDESQYVKNEAAQRSKALHNIRREHTVILTGTPIENSIDEIWAQFDLLFPGLSILRAKLAKIGTSPEKMAEISKMILSPFILRRTKKEILKDFPEKEEIEIYIELSSYERNTYERIRSAFKSALKKGVTGRINSIALECLLRLKQCCVSCNLLPKSLSRINDFESTKMVKAIALIRDMIAAKHKVLVFSQFAEAISELERCLQRVGLRSYTLTGKTTDRQTLIDDFQTSDSIMVLLISLKAGGAGINLTAADRVIFIDDWWNPATESQAYSRAHRIGQMNDVKIYRIICKNTVEEKILQLHESKKEIADLFNVTDSKLTLDQIKEIIL